MQLIREGKKEKALRLLEYCKKVIPPYNVPYNPMSVGLTYSANAFVLPEAWRLVGRPQEAERILLAMAKNSRQYLDWYNSLSDSRLASYGQDCNRHVLYLSMVINGLHACQSKHAAEYEKYFDGLMQTRIGPIVMQAMQHQ